MAEVELPDPEELGEKAEKRYNAEKMDICYTLWARLPFLHH